MKTPPAETDEEKLEYAVLKILWSLEPLPSNVLRVVAIKTALERLRQADRKREKGKARKNG